MPAGQRPRIAPESPAHYTNQEPARNSTPPEEQNSKLPGVQEELLTDGISRAKDNSVEVVNYQNEETAWMADFQEFLKQELQSSQRTLTKCVVENNRRMFAAVTKRAREVCQHLVRQNTALRTELLQFREVSMELEGGSTRVSVPGMPDLNPSLSPGLTVPGTVLSDTDDFFASSLTSFHNQKSNSKKNFDANMASVPVPLMILAHRQPPTLNLPDPGNTAIAATTPSAKSALAVHSVLQSGDAHSSPDGKHVSLAPYDPSSEVSYDPGSQASADEMVIQSNYRRMMTQEFAKSRKTSQSENGNPRESVISTSHPRNSGSGPRTALKNTKGTTRVFTEAVRFGVFADAESMKEKVRQAIGKQDYSIQNFYKETGFAQAIARSSAFEYITLTMIALNGVWIGVDTDHNKSDALADAPLAYQFIENLFCTYFVAEWGVRLLALRRVRDGMSDSWFVFDGVLVLLMVFETWGMYVILLVSDSASGDSKSGGERLGNASVLRLMKLLRLSRMARMVRLLRAVPELMILVKGISVATRSVFFTLCLLVVIIYIFGIAFTQLTLDSTVGKKYFNDVLSSMNTLLLYGTFLEDTPDVINEIGDESWALRALFLVFILLASLTVMNMLVGVLVEVVSVVSSVEKEQLQVNFVKTRLAQIMEDYALDANADGKVTKAEFEMLLGNPEAARALRDVGVDVIGLVDYHDFLFADGSDSFSFENFMQVVLSLRGSNKSTVKDVVDLRKFIMSELGRIEEKLTLMLESCGASRINHKLPAPSLFQPHE